jgi:leucyl/phenylalanyl-tRNA--protein transferase
MPVYLLTDELRFPPPEGASPEGIVAIGGDFRPERLLLGYGQGIFPWPSEGLPLLWFSPDPRFVLEPRDAHLPRSLRKQLKRMPYTIRFDTAFGEVIRACAATKRPGQRGTWITDELICGYEQLFELGFAHSVEAYQGDELVGGLYGVSLGRAFFGESMFANAPDASKLAFAMLLAQFVAWEVQLVDCQVYTDHLARFGAGDWPRALFLARLRDALTQETLRGRWTLEVTPEQALSLLR